MPLILIIIFFFPHPLCRGLYRGQNKSNNRYGHYGNLSAAAVNHFSLDGIYFITHPNT